MNIRQTRQEDLAEVMAMYDYARRFMQEHGNGNQWINGYPSKELISNEIKASHSFVCENEQGELVGTFCYIEGIDPTYLKIYEGEWLNDEPYAVIHRMASNGKQKGISTECLKWAFAHCDNIRIDTHRDNIVMQNLRKISGITSKNGRNDAKRLNIRVVTMSNDDKPKNRKTQRKADLRRRMVCKSLPVKE